jgi:hypothetical protein
MSTRSFGGSVSTSIGQLLLMNVVPPPLVLIDVLWLLLEPPVEELFEEDALLLDMLTLTELLESLVAWPLLLELMDTLVWPPAEFDTFCSLEPFSGTAIFWPLTFK